MTEAFRAWRHLVRILFSRHAAEDAGVNWQIAISFANAGLVTGVLWSELTRRPELSVALTDDERDYLSSYHQLTQSRNRAIRAQALACIELLAEDGIAALPLKGAAYLIENLGDALSRFISDIDLLVPADRAQAARNALIRAGYRDAPVSPVAGAEHHHLTALLHDDLPAAVELHTAVVPKTLAAALPTDAVWARANPVRIDPVDVPLPSPTDAATISFLHGELVDLGTLLLTIPLRLFHDLHTLQTAHGHAIDWQEIAGRADAVNGGARLRRYLYYYERLSGSKVPANRRHSLTDAASYRAALAAIDHPSIYEWRRRIDQLSERRLRQRYKTDGAIQIGLARCRALAGMLANAVTRRDE